MFDLPGAAGPVYMFFDLQDGDAGHRVPAGDFAQVIKRAGVLNACGFDATQRAEPDD